MKSEKRLYDKTSSKGNSIVLLFFLWSFNSFSQEKIKITCIHYNEIVDSISDTSYYKTTSDSIQAYIFKLNNQNCYIPAQSNTILPKRDPIYMDNHGTDLTVTSHYSENDLLSIQNLLFISTSNELYGSYALREEIIYYFYNEKEQLIETKSYFIDSGKKQVLIQHCTINWEN